MSDRIIKLALWHTKTFTPILTHQDLEPIMATLGFASLPLSTNPCNLDGSASSDTLWKEYSYSSSCSFKRSSDPPRPKLPYPVIDGLHVCTYQAFLDSVSFYLRVADDLSNIFHIRGMTLDRVHDRNGNWSRMEESGNNNSTVYAYREGLLDISAYNSWKANKNDVNNCSNKSKGYDSNVFRRGSNILAGCKFVSMKDVVVERSTKPKSRNYNREEQYTSRD